MNHILLMIIPWLVYKSEINIHKKVIFGKYDPSDVLTLGHKWDSNFSQQRRGAASDPPNHSSQLLTLIFSLFFNFCSHYRVKLRCIWATDQAAVFEALAVRKPCRYWTVECLLGIMLWRALIDCHSWHTLHAIQTKAVRAWAPGCASPGCKYDTE